MFTLNNLCYVLSLRNIISKPCFFRYRTIYIRLSQMKDLAKTLILKLASVHTT